MDREREVSLENIAALHDSRRERLAALKDTIRTEEGLRSLMEIGRVPLLVFHGKTQRSTAMLHLSPPGTKPTDTYRYKHSLFLFSDAKGELKGLSVAFYIPKRDLPSARRLVRTIQAEFYGQQG